jgi:hypothetical protein
MGGGGTEGGKNSLRNIDNIKFDEADVAADFKNQLWPPPATPTVTQPQGDDGIAPPPVTTPVVGGQQHQPQPPPPPQAPASEAYSGLD